MIVENKSGRQALLARVVVDATGDGDVAGRAGAPFWQVAHDEARRLNDGLMVRIQFGDTRPASPFACDFGANAVVWGPATGPINGIDADELSAAEVKTRLAVYEDFAAKQAKHTRAGRRARGRDAAVAGHPPDPLHRGRVQTDR